MRNVLVAQGLYYFLSGLWPLVHMPSFERVTGPKTDDWLVQVVGALTVAIATTLLVGAARNGRLARETLVLAGTSALAFGAVDVVFYAMGTLSPLYLADAAVQAGIVTTLASGLRRSQAY